jgi:fluoroquinolone transport system permease protein
MLLERGEGTLDVVMVSPLRPGEYLASKMITVTGLALVESALIAGIAYGLGFAYLWLVLAVVLRAAGVSAVGVAVGARYRSITHFIFPMALLTMVLDLPVLWYFEIWPSSFFYLWPTLPSLLLAKAAFLPVDPIQLVYGVLYGVLAVVAAVAWALRSIDRFIVRGDLEA